MRTRLSLLAEGIELRQPGSMDPLDKFDTLGDLGISSDSALVRRPVDCQAMACGFCCTALLIRMASYAALLMHVLYFRCNFVNGLYPSSCISVAGG